MENANSCSFWGIIYKTDIGSILIGWNNKQFLKARSDFMSEESLILTQRSLTCRLLRDVAVSIAARTFRCGRNYQEKQWLFPSRWAEIEKLFCSAHLLPLKFKRFASGSHSPSKESCGILCSVCQGGNGRWGDGENEKKNKIEVLVLLVPADTSNLHFCSPNFNCCLRHTRVWGHVVYLHLDVFWTDT